MYCLDNLATWVDVLLVCLFVADIGEVAVQMLQQLYCLSKVPRARGENVMMVGLFAADRTSKWCEVQQHQPRTSWSALGSSVLCSEPGAMRPAQPAVTALACVQV
jgi:hypothetical protein